MHDDITAYVGVRSSAHVMYSVSPAWNITGFGGLWILSMQMGTTDTMAASAQTPAMPSSAFLRFKYVVYL